MAIHQVVDVITVRNRFMSAVRPVDMAGRVSGARVIRCAGGRIGGGHFQRAFIEVSFMRRVEVPVVQIIDVPVVADRDVSAAFTVDVIVVFVNVVAHLAFALLGLGFVGVFRWHAPAR